LVNEVNALKQQAGQDVIAFGGVGFASSLVAEGLVDEFQFFVNPTAVAAGRSIFHNRDGTKLKLIRPNSYDCSLRRT
jgi:dihydrofolate reductase